MRPGRRAISGVVLLDKPPGITSTAALTRVKSLYRAEKAGHTGTLDPFASGLLPICLGEATKFAGFMLESDKRYLATLLLGRTTTTGDPEGETLSDTETAIARATIERVLDEFRGAIRQVPPMHSALKHGGEPLYRLARRGLEVPREAREVTIHELMLRDYQAPLLTIEVACSKGTYIRTLAADIGASLGCGAMLTALRRTASGRLSLQDAISLDRLAGLDDGARDAQLQPVDSLVCGLPEISVDDAATRALLSGRAALAPGSGAGPMRAYSPSGRFIGVVESAPGGRLTALRMMAWRAGLDS